MISRACILALFSVVAAADYAQSATPVTVSLCAIISHGMSFDGKLVKVQARYGHTWEGAYLGDQECDGDIYIAFENDPTLPPPYRTQATWGQNWKEFDRAASHICTGIEPDTKKGNCTYDYLRAEFVGVIVVKRNFRVKNGFGNGFGHMGLSKIALVPQGVSNIAPHRITDERE